MLTAVVEAMTAGKAFVVALALLALNPENLLPVGATVLWARGPTRC